MLKIYGSSLSSPANKVRLCANALGLEYEYTELNIPEGEHKTEEFLAINPVGKVPAIDDDGFTLFESGAIIKYLCRKHNSDYYPQDLKKQAEIDQWTDYVCLHVLSAMARILFNKTIAPMIGAEVDENSLKVGQSFLTKYLPIIDTRLGKSKYLASDELSIADFTLLTTMDPAEIIELDLSPYPNLVAWRNSLKEEEFYQKVHKFYGEALMAA